MGMIGVDDEERESGDSDDSGGFGGAASPHLDCEPQGTYVTPDRIEKVLDLLEADESVHYVLKSSLVKEIQAHVPNQHNEISYASIKGANWGAVTDRRLVIYVPSLLGDGHMSFPYESITDIHLGKAIISDQISFRTAQNTYRVNVVEPDRDEIDAATDFMLERMNSGGDENVIEIEIDHEEVEGDSDPESIEPDPFEQLRELHTLHEEGIITGEEFEAKKAELLEEI